ncbi:hypothetical protein FM110_13515 [Brachybacterium nesterenkovii]|uniref:Uncharacterized protein n=1 Tax=Brachybacterium nesterenkovii TaxID=47847 RepID=A0A1X6X9M4_9MICO|nr:hypothetical protein FM110_13515 [Brachybacterium nesterenkovii]
MGGGHDVLRGEGKRGSPTRPRGRPGRTEPIVPARFPGSGNGMVKTPRTLVHLVTSPRHGAARTPPRVS